jgi:hypothetical protein
MVRIIDPNRDRHEGCKRLILGRRLPGEVPSIPGFCASLEPQ